MRRLIAGPWIGEFGWELMSWQALVRKASYDYDEVVVCGPAGHEALYQDFRPIYLAHHVNGTKDCWWTTGHSPALLNATNDALRTYQGDWLKPSGLIPTERQHFVRYGHAEACEPDDVFDVVIHARARIGKRPWHAWAEDKWNRLVQELLRRGVSVAAIGTEAFCPEGAEDRRRIVMSDLMNLLARAVLAAGPSSGPMHLASLCKTPHVVWTDTQRYSAIGGTNRIRYESVWNPLKTPCKIVDQHGWDPEPEIVLDAVLEGLDSWRKL